MRDSNKSGRKWYGASAAAATDDARLEHAMQQADDLLVRSLQSDERQRRGRRKTLVYILIAGGVTMFAILCAVLIALTAVGTTAVAQADDSAALTQEGWQLWQQQQPDQAREKFEQALKLAPKNTNAWNGLGWSNFNSGRNAEAEKAFQKVIALEPKHAAALNGLGQLALLERKYDAAEKYLLKAAPQAPAAWYGLAKLYLLQGQYDQAQKWAQKIIDSGEADEGVKEMLAAADAKQLSPQLRSLIEPPAPTDSAAEFAAAWRYFNQGRNAEAREIFEKLLKEDPDNANVLNGLGWSLLNSGMADEAKPHFEKALKQNPDASGVLNGLGCVLREQGKLDEAIDVWKHMLKVSSGPNAGTYNLSEAYLTRGNYKDALPLLEQMVKARPQDERLQAKLKLAQEKVGS